MKLFKFKSIILSLFILAAFSMEGCRTLPIVNIKNFGIDQLFINDSMDRVLTVAGKYYKPYTVKVVKSIDEPCVIKISGNTKEIKILFYKEIVRSIHIKYLNQSDKNWKNSLNAIILKYGEAKNVYSVGGDSPDLTEFYSKSFPEKVIWYSWHIKDERYTIRAVRDYNAGTIELRFTDTYLRKLASKRR